ncbi:tellurite resistance TerB family protein [Palleronia sp. LCG004]|uniref:tellurite resistance TerB family protein n=1 Tax=Palleronia sp. LCG004 TaxID=3079304 RepID=UPI0029436DFD|nr:DUF533 domain-containing protein [Palleronia sp. LCG004]WOI58367.1 DUF533 domain-containing protein [Palleronia sp. LCG004]
MSLKRILGTMLATRMAGRGRRRGALGTASMLGLGRRRRRPGMGVAALGYMAYRAYQDHQSRNAVTAQTGSATAGQPDTTQGATGTRSGTEGGLMGMVQDAVDKISGAMQPERQGTRATSGTGTAAVTASDDAEMQEEARAAEDLSDRTALLLIRAMITAAYADGSLSTEERERIMSEIAEAGGTAEDRAVMEREIANPKPLDELLAEVDNAETAEEFYLASRAAIDGESETDRHYLAQLRERLGLSDEQVAEIEEMAAE